MQQIHQRKVFPLGKEIEKKECTSDDDSEKEETSTSAEKKNGQN